jgi:hypothetical protein
MVEDKWLLLFGVPVIIALVISIRRRIRAIGARLQEIERVEQAKPSNPYEELAAMWQDTKTSDKSKSKRSSLDSDCDIGNQDNG